MISAKIRLNSPDAENTWRRNNAPSYLFTEPDTISLLMLCFSFRRWIILYMQAHYSQHEIILSYATSLVKYKM